MEAQNTLVDSSGQQSLTEIKIDSYSTIFLVTFQSFLRWWYVKMPLWHLRKLARISVVVDDQLSITLLIKNFFVPWHRDNSVVGITFGIIMKILYLPIALIIYLLSVITYFFCILIWLLLPIGSLVFIIISIF